MYTKSAHKGEFQRTSADDKSGCIDDVLKLKSPVLDTKNSRSDIKNRAFSSVPTVRLELTTAGLQNRCTKITSPDNTNTYNSNKTTGTHPGTQQRAPEAQIDPDLQVLIEHWKDLPEHIKATIKMLAETAGKK